MSQRSPAATSPASHCRVAHREHSQNNTSHTNRKKTHACVAAETRTLRAPNHVSSLPVFNCTPNFTFAVPQPASETWCRCHVFSTICTSSPLSSRLVGCASSSRTPAETRPHFYQLSLCLSRACLGKHSICSLNCIAKKIFPHRSGAAHHRSTVS